MRCCRCGGSGLIVHATHSEASRRISPKMLFALLLLAPRALLLTLHVYCKPSGGRASRFFFPPSRADERSQPPSPSHPPSRSRGYWRLRGILGNTHGRAMDWGEAAFGVYNRTCIGLPYVCRWSQRAPDTGPPKSANSARLISPSLVNLWKSPQ